MRELCEETGLALSPDDGRDARWFPVSALPPLAFDHDQVLKDALIALQQ